MKKHILFSIVCAALAVGAVSCKKDSTTSNPSNNNNNNNPQPTTGWNWKEGSTSFTADSAFMNMGYKTFIVHKNNSDTANRRFFEINLTGDVVGTYDFATPGNAFLYLSGSRNSFNATGGTLKITAAANNKWSGEFNVTGTGSNGVTAISGTFKDIPGR